MFPTNLTHFSTKDNWGEPNKMVPEFVYALDALRDNLGFPFIITAGTQGVHLPHSLHYQGRAADFVCPAANISVLDMLFEIFRHPFTGIGYYPDWQYMGQTCGGWHLDMSEPPSQIMLKNGFIDRVPRKRLWMGVKELSGQAYIALNEANLRLHKAIT